MMAAVDEEKDRLVSISQAARMLGVTRQTVYAMIGRGELRVERFVGLPYLNRAEVMEVGERREVDVVK